MAPTTPMPRSSQNPKAPSPPIPAASINNEHTNRGRENRSDPFESRFSTSAMPPYPSPRYLSTNFPWCPIPACSINNEYSNRERENRSDPFEYRLIPSKRGYYAMYQHEMEQQLPHDMYQDYLHDPVMYQNEEEQQLQYDMYQHLHDPAMYQHEEEQQLESDMYQHLHDPDCEDIDITTSAPAYSSSDASADPSSDAMSFEFSVRCHDHQLHETAASKSYNISPDQEYNISDEGQYARQPSEFCCSDEFCGFCRANADDLPESESLNSNSVRNEDDLQNSPSQESYCTDELCGFCRANDLPNNNNVLDNEDDLQNNPPQKMDVISNNNECCGHTAHTDLLDDNLSPRLQRRVSTHDADSKKVTDEYYLDHLPPPEDLSDDDKFNDIILRDLSSRLKRRVTTHDGSKTITDEYFHDHPPAGNSLDSKYKDNIPCYLSSRLKRRITTHDGSKQITDEYYHDQLPASNSSRVTRDDMAFLALVLCVLTCLYLFFH